MRWWRRPVEFFFLALLDERFELVLLQVKLFTADKSEIRTWGRAVVALLIQIGAPLLLELRNL